VDGPTRAADWERTAQAFQQAAAVQRKAVRLALQEPMTGQALLGLVQWIAAPPQAAPATPRPARRWARQRTERLHQRWKKAQRKASDPASLHRARLLAKRLRYTIEALQPLLPGATQRWHAQALQAREQVAVCAMHMAALLAARLQAPAEVVAFLRGMAAAWEQTVLPEEAVD
jgi:CHAD domain-containing protein